MSNIDGLNQYSLTKDAFRYHKPVNNGLYCEVSDVITLLKERDKRIKELEEDQYIPGIHRCAKCKFRLISQSIDVKTGTIGANDKPSDCPNGCGPMWRVTYKESYKDEGKSADHLHHLLDNRDNEIKELKAEVLAISNRHNDLLNRMGKTH